MKRSLWPRLAAAVVTVGLLGVVAYYFFWDPVPSYRAVAAETVPSPEDEDLQALAERRVFFGHMSVGNNILSGLRAAAEASPDVSLNELEVAVGDQPQLPDGGVLVHALIGENRHPVGKLGNFDAMLRAGLADQIDVAVLKFCYIDVRWNSDAEDLFNRYRDTLARLEADYPDVRFVHMTVPLTTGPYGIRDHLKVLVGRDDNATRERYNDLMRAEYGSRLFDLAALEATGPDGALVPRELYEGYSSDGAHLNAPGSAYVAAAFADFLAADAG